MISERTMNVRISRVEDLVKKYRGKEKKGVAGIYRHGDYAEVDIMAQNNLGFSYLVYHETVHMMLCKRSTYGCFLYLLKKIVNYDSRIGNTFDYLESAMNNMQESVATFVEYGFYLKNKGLESFKEKINIAKTTNNCDYKRIKSLLFFLDNYDYIPVEEKIKIIWQFGLIALSSKITDIPSDILLHKKHLEKYMSNQQNTITYLPSTRFNKLIKTLKHILDNNHNQSINAEDILNAANLTIEELDIQEIIDYVIKSCKSLESAIEINKRLDSIYLMECTHEEAVLSINPTPLKPYKVEQIEIGNLIKIESKLEGAFFILSHLINENDGQESYWVTFIDLCNKVNKVSSINKVDLLKYINSITNPIVIPPNLYDYERNTILGFENKISNPLFVYWDVPYSTKKFSLSEYTDEKAEGILIEYPNMNLLLVKFDRTINFLQPIMKDCEHIFRKDVKKKLFNIELKRGMLDEHLRIIDIIINSVLQTW